jgi:hypothetical protein
MNPYYNPNVNETLYDVVNILEQIITAISRLDFSFFDKNNDEIRLSEIFTLLDIYKNGDIVSYSKRCVIPDKRIIIAKKDLSEINECYVNNKIIFLDHILRWTKLANDSYIKFELKNLDDKLEQIETKELQTTFLQKQIDHFINKNATHNYSFYNEIIDILKIKLSNRNVNSCNLTLKNKLEVITVIDNNSDSKLIIEKLNEIKNDTDKINEKLDVHFNYLISKLGDSSFKGELLKSINQITSNNQIALSTDIFQALSELDFSIDGRLEELYIDLKKSSNLEAKIKLGIPLMQAITGCDIEVKFDVKKWGQEMYKKYKLNIFKMMGYIG